MAAPSGLFCDSSVRFAFIMFRSAPVIRSSDPVIIVGKHLVTPVENITRSDFAMSSTDADGSL
jgi:hypothetical protein